MACAPGDSAAPARSDGDHEHVAPHGGSLVELGDELAHVELVLDPSLGRITAYVLDGEAEQPVRIAQPALVLAFDAPASLAGRRLELKPRASVLTGERPGDASEFAVADEGLRDHGQVSGRLVEIAVRGQTFRDAAFTGVGPPAQADR